MTKNDYKKIAQCLKNFKEAQVKNIKNDNYIPLEFLIDEFAYILEKNKNFDEKEFRQFIYRENKKV